MNIDSNIYWLGLIPLLPVLAALWIALGYLSGRNCGEAGEGQTSIVAVGSVLLSLFGLLWLDVQTLLTGVAPGYIIVANWFGVAEVQFQISFLLDAFALGMATLVALLALLGLRFSVNYMHREAGYQRFFMILCLFTAAMLLIVMAGNAVLVFVGWELAGLSSYLLIAYSYERTTAAANATRVFITNRIGDAGFIIAIALSYFWLGSSDWSVINTAGQSLESMQYALLGIAFVLAALVKSAQVPFTPWLARALEGPTPSSALFYGALMVHAGVYLLIRLQPLLEQIPELMTMLLVIGLLTSLYGFFGQLVQVDTKSMLIFSTSTQVGLMVAFCGLGWFKLAAGLLFLHAIWRGFQFFNAPGLMHLMGRATRPAPAFLKKCQRLYVASLQRFWLDSLADGLLVRPTQSLAKDAQYFEQHVVNRMVGLADSAGSVSSLAQWEAFRLDGERRVRGDYGDIAVGRGMLGRSMQWLAMLLHWFEEHLVLSGGDEGIKRLILRLGSLLMRVDELLSHPRYLLLMVAVTFVVILS
ncbi:NADH-ubiquinone oxidoreductase chain L-like protein, cluster 1 [hydrothermal vent metagenome]|uniref:NADH-ubiquinone oxidoreductase chain L-like protein, cluster 1 n=1 Tax=hydrothermal vent metagenome TaxID=652676 RepID=A0A3B1B9U5_9ZZZZ